MRAGGVASEEAARVGLEAEVRGVLSCDTSRPLIVAQGHPHTPIVPERHHDRPHPRRLHERRKPYATFLWGFRTRSSLPQVLHLLAMARAADIPLTIDDFQDVADRTPYLADLK